MPQWQKAMTPSTFHPVPWAIMVFHDTPKMDFETKNLVPEDPASGRPLPASASPTSGFRSFFPASAVNE
jgi:hypothetical protein